MEGALINITEGKSCVIAEMNGVMRVVDRARKGENEAGDGRKGYVAKTDTTEADGGGGEGVGVIREGFLVGKKGKEMLVGGGEGGDKGGRPRSK